MKIRLNKKRLTDIAFIIPSLAGVSIFVLIPFIDVLRRSFTNVAGTQFVFLSNYITIFQNSAFRLAFFNTIKFMVICIPILMASSLLIAVFLNAGIRGANFLKSAYLVPMAIPVASVVLIWRFTRTAISAVYCTCLVCSLRIGWIQALLSGFLYSVMSGKISVIISYYGWQG